LRVAVTDGSAGLIVGRTFVQSLGTVFLGSNGRGQVKHHHLHEGISGRQKLPHYDLNELLALQFFLIISELDFKLIEQREDFVLLVVGDRGEDLEDRIENELIEGAFERLALVLAVLGPFLGLGIEEIVTLS
jgi:hypothetical protein